MRQYILNTLIGFDQWMNSLLGGDPQETISARAARATIGKRYWGRALCWFLDKLEKGHCETALLSLPEHLKTDEEVLDIESSKK